MSDGPAPKPAMDAGATGNGARLEAPALPPHRHAVPVGLLVAAVLVALDQLTKELAQAVLEPGRFVPWLGPDIGWQLVFNPGGAFGIPAPHWLFLLVTVGVVGLVARVLPRTPTLLSAAAYGLLLGGAIGNVLDRLFKPGGDGFGTGYVVDFVAWGSFPRFNVADSAITVGFVLLVIALLVEERRAESALEAATDEARRGGSGGGGSGAGELGTGAVGSGGSGGGETGTTEVGSGDTSGTRAPADGEVAGDAVARDAAREPGDGATDGAAAQADPADPDADGAAGERGSGA